VNVNWRRQGIEWKAGTAGTGSANSANSRVVGHSENGFPHGAASGFVGSVKVQYR
jgi:hypothetical protein